MGGHRRLCERRGAGESGRSAAVAFAVGGSCTHNAGNGRPSLAEERLWIAAGLAGLFAVVLAGVIIKVTGPDGKETTVEAPDGSNVKVDPMGNVIVRVPGIETPKPLAVVPPGDYALKFEGEGSVAFDGASRITSPIRSRLKRMCESMRSSPNAHIYSFTGQNGLLLDPQDGKGWRFSHTIYPQGYYGIQDAPLIVQGYCQHIAAVSDSNGFCLYADGKQIGEGGTVSRKTDRKPQNRQRVNPVRHQVPGRDRRIAHSPASLAIPASSHLLHALQRMPTPLPSTTATKAAAKSSMIPPATATTARSSGRNG